MIRNYHDCEHWKHHWKEPHPQKHVTICLLINLHWSDHNIIRQRAFVHVGPKNKTMDAAASANSVPQPQVKCTNVF